MNSELQGAGSDEGRITTAGLQVSEVLSMTSELQGAGGDEGRSSTTGLQVTSEVLVMNSELQGAGSDEGRTTNTGLQVISEVLSRISELQAESQPHALAEVADAIVAKPRSAMGAGKGGKDIALLTLDEGELDVLKPDAETDGGLVDYVISDLERAAALREVRGAVGALSEAVAMLPNLSCKVRKAQRRRLRAEVTEAFVDWIHAFGEPATDVALAESLVFLA